MLGGAISRLFPCSRVFFPRLIKTKNLGKEIEKVLPKEGVKDMLQIRNIGVIAHIDAGKTTTTERMLYYAGALKVPGDVDDGNTKMDYLEEERDRGITIRAASISFNWEEIQINLIDTPGHIDFSAEVERSLRVVDGAVVIFDAGQGVQSQSESVWLLANKFNIPRFSFINKMDRLGASFERAVHSIQTKLPIKSIPINIPIGEEQGFKGIIDLISFNEIKWIDELGNRVDITPLSTSHPFYNTAIKYREEMLITLSDYDESLMEQYLKDLPISPQQITQVICNATRACKLNPILCGSALKNKGIQPLLNAIITLLPSPTLIPHLHKNMFKALAFKVLHYKTGAPCTFVRVYNGQLNNKTEIKIINNGQIEKVNTLLRVRADEATNIEAIGAGDIGAIRGAKKISAGDTLVDSKSSIKSPMSGVNSPPPVFFCSIEPHTGADQQLFDLALQNMTREDPSLTGQNLVCGLGELHLEILKDRLLSEYDLRVDMGRMRVAYREAVVHSREMCLRVEEKFADQDLFAELRIKMEPIYREGDLEKWISGDSWNPTKESSVKSENEIVFENLEGDRKIEEERTKRRYYVKQDLWGGKIDRNKRIEEGERELIQGLGNGSPQLLEYIKSSINHHLETGPLMSYPIINTRIIVCSGLFSDLRSGPNSFNICINRIMGDLLQNAGVGLLEPFVRVEIFIPTYALANVLSDVNQRRGNIWDILEGEEKYTTGLIDQNRRIVRATLPLSEMVAYATFLRSISKGQATFIMNFHSFQYVGVHKQTDILNGIF